MSIPTPAIVPDLEKYPRARNAIYLLLGTLGVVTFLTFVGYVAAEAQPPTWLVVASAVLNAAASMFFVASKNTPTEQGDPPSQYVGRRVRQDQGDAAELTDG